MRWHLSWRTLLWCSALAVGGAGCFFESSDDSGHVKADGGAGDGGLGCVCTLEYAPVCGVDGATYGNACAAECAGVRVAHSGACDPCAVVDCAEGHHCEAQEVECLVAPCPLRAVCVLDEDSCALVDCRPGYHCEVQEVECVAAPCPPQPVCVPPDDQCSLVPDPGPCDAAFLRWYFDAETGTCQQFTYGGCQGNANNFESEAECEAACQPGCKRAGCSGELCIEASAPDIATTCIFLPEYACYQQATCERQADGSCGFTPTAELEACLADASTNP